MKIIHSQDQWERSLSCFAVRLRRLIIKTNCTLCISQHSRGWSNYFNEAGDVPDVSELRRNRSLSLRQRVSAFSLRERHAWELNTLAQSLRRAVFSTLSISRELAFRLTDAARRQISFLGVNFGLCGARTATFTARGPLREWRHRELFCCKQ